MKNTYLVLSLILFSFITFQCKVEEEETPTISDNTPKDTGTTTNIWSAFFTDLNVYEEGNFMVIESNGVPNHKSPYFDPSDDRFEAYNGTNSEFKINPNDIIEQQFTFKIPINPTEAGSKEATGLGPMGVAINGIPLFNQYAGPNQPLTDEINSFDQYNGHPQQQGQYHYHLEPLYLTSLNGRESLIGVLLDGFPVYGPEENGATITNADLDQYHGHFGKTKEFPEGIYHYHVTAEDPYMNGDGYFGTPGTVTN